MDESENACLPCDWVEKLMIWKTMTWSVAVQQLIKSQLYVHSQWVKCLSDCQTYETVSQKQEQAHETIGHSRSTLTLFGVLQQYMYVHTSYIPWMPEWKLSECRNRVVVLLKPNQEVFLPKPNQEVLLPKPNQEISLTETLTN